MTAFDPRLGLYYDLPITRTAAFFCEVRDIPAADRDQLGPELMLGFPREDTALTIAMADANMGMEDNNHDTAHGECQPPAPTLPRPASPTRGPRAHLTHRSLVPSAVLQRLPSHHPDRVRAASSLTWS